MVEPQKQLLVVDDEPVIRRSLSTYLTAAGYSVQLAVDGLDALRHLRVCQPDLIICDLNMPSMSGSEFLAVVRKRLPQIPVVVISGSPPEQMPEGLPADAYFHKNGFGLERLLLLVSALTRKPAPRPPLAADSNAPAQARWSGGGQYSVSCDDCLRELCIPRSSNIGREENWTVCVHCGKLIRFLICDHPNPSLPG